MGGTQRPLPQSSTVGIGTAKRSPSPLMLIPAAWAISLGDLWHASQISPSSRILCSGLSPSVGSCQMLDVATSEM